MSGSEDVKATTLSATPYTTSATYLPTDLGDYNYFSSVTVDAIAYATSTNIAGGIIILYCKYHNLITDKKLQIILISGLK